MCLVEYITNPSDTHKTSPILNVRPKSVNTTIQPFCSTFEFLFQRDFKKFKRSFVLEERVVMDIMLKNNHDVSERSMPTKIK